jgi:glycerol uptake facilitator-like aquaporin
VQDRGLAAYIAELIGTLFLVLAVGTVVSLYLSTSPQSQTGSDFAVIGLVHAFVLFLLIVAFGAASGGHFNPAVTLAAWASRRIDPVDAVVYVLAQLSGAVLGALLVKGILLDEGRASDYGAAKISPLLGGAFPAFVVEALGTFLLVLAVCTVAFGTTLGFGVMIFGPLTGGSFNPARWFGPALIGDAFGDFSDIWPYLAGPIVGALVAFGIYRYVIAGPQYALGAEPPTTDVRGAAQALKDVDVRERSD